MGDEVKRKGTLKCRGGNEIGAWKRIRRWKGKMQEEEEDRARIEGEGKDR